MTELGEVVPLGIIVRDEAGIQINAETVALTITLPDDTTVLPAVQNPPATVGHYAIDYVPRELPGLYRWRWETDRPALVLEGAFHVDPPGSVGILSLAQAKSVLGMESDDRHNREIMAAVQTATALAEDVRHEKLMRTTVTETRELGRSPLAGFALTWGPVQSIVSVERFGPYGAGPLPAEVRTPPDVWVDGNGIVRANSRALLWGLCRFTYVAGYRVVPPQFTTAVEYILQAVWQNRRGSSMRPKVAGQSEDMQDRSEAASIPRRAYDLLGAYQRGPLVG